MSEIAAAKISIIIPSFKSQKILGKVLNAIFAQKTSAPFEVILVDSTPGIEVDEIVQNYSGLQFVKQQTQTSASRARNLGAELAKGELLLFLDSDVTLDEDALENVWDCYKRGCKVFSGSFTLDNSFGFSLSSFVEFCFFFAESLPNNPNKYRKNLPSTLLAIEKTLFNQYGPFKEYGRNEDTDLTERICKAGDFLYYCPEIHAKFFQEVSFIYFLRKCKINGVNFPYLRMGNDLSFKKRVFLLVALPLVSITKFFVMLYRNLSYRKNLKEKILFILILPLIMLGVFCSFFGGLVTIFTDPGINPSR